MTEPPAIPAADVTPHKATIAAVGILKAATAAGLALLAFLLGYWTGQAHR